MSFNQYKKYGTFLVGNDLEIIKSATQEITFLKHDLYSNNEFVTTSLINTSIFLSKGKIYYYTHDKATGKVDWITPLNMCKELCLNGQYGLFYSFKNIQSPKL